MKKLILMLAMCVPLISFAQSSNDMLPGCGTFETAEDYAYDQAARKAFPTYLKEVENMPFKANLTRFIDVRCIIVRRSNGTDGISRADVDSYIQAFNQSTAVVSEQNTLRVKLNRCAALNTLIIGSITNTTPVKKMPCSIPFLSRRH